MLSPNPGGNSGSHFKNTLRRRGCHQPAHLPIKYKNAALWLWAHLFCLGSISTAAEKMLTRDTGSTSNIMQALAELFEISSITAKCNSTATQKLRQRECVFKYSEIQGLGYSLRYHDPVEGREDAVSVSEDSGAPCMCWPWLRTTGDTKTQAPENLKFTAGTGGLKKLQPAKHSNIIHIFKNSWTLSWIWFQLCMVFIFKVFWTREHDLFDLGLCIRRYVKPSCSNTNWASRARGPAEK